MKTLLASLLLVAATSSYAAMQEHTYMADIEGPMGCSMPEDMHRPLLGDCKIVLNTFKTGTTIVRKGSKCIKVEREHVGTKVEPTPNGYLREVPQINSNMTSVTCPK